MMILKAHSSFYAGEYLGIKSLGKEQQEVIAVL